MSWRYSPKIRIIRTRPGTSGGGGSSAPAYTFFAASFWATGFWATGFWK